MSHPSSSVARSFPSVDYAASPFRTEGEAHKTSKADTMHERNRVTVCLRIRPPVDFDSDRDHFLRRSNRRPNRVTTIENSLHRQQAFEFDNIFTDQSTQADIYQLTARPLISSFLDGQNVCCLAFGQSKSGKTFTTMGELDTTSLKPVRDSVDYDNSSASGVSSLGSCGVSELVTKEKLLPTRVTAAAHSRNLAGVPKHLGITDNPDLHSKSQIKQPRKVELPGIQEHQKGEIFPSFITEQTGIIPRLICQTLWQIESTEKSRKAILKLYCSYVEIHYNTVIDLLADPHSPSNTVTLQKSIDGNLSLEGAVEELIINCNFALELLQRKASKRQDDTDNPKSSFYHSIFVLKLEKKNYASQETTNNFFCVIDLAKSDVLLLNDSEDGSGTSFPIKHETFAFRTLTTLCSTLSNTTESEADHQDTFSDMIQVAFGHVTKICLILNVSSYVTDSRHTLQTLHYGRKVMSLERSNGERQNLMALDQSNEDKAEYLARVVLQEEDIKEKKMSYLGSKMLEMQDELQKFRIGADERSKFSTRSFKSNRNRSARESSISSRSKAHDSFQTILEASNQHFAKKEDVAALDATSDHRTDPKSLHSAATQERGVETSTETPLVENLSREKVYTALREESIAMENSRASSQNESGLQELLSVERLRHKLRKRERMLKERDAVILGMRKENLALAKSKMKRQVMLEKAKIEMKALLDRVIEAESHLSEVKEACLSASASQDIAESTKALNKKVSTTAISNGQISTTEEQSNFTVLTTGTVDTSTVREEPVRVGLRLRPLNKLEASRRSRCCIDIQEGSTDFTVDSPLDGEYDFHYDKVFGMNSSQGEVYEFIRKSWAQDILDGVNCCCVVYGLKGSGRSYSMLGSVPDPWERMDGVSACSTADDKNDKESTSNSHQSAYGIIPRFLNDLFNGIECANENLEFFVRCSFVGVYLEKFFDLVEPQSNKNLLVSNDGNNILIDGVGEVWCFRDSDATAVIRRGTASLAELSRQMGIDVHNFHKIFIVSVEQRDSLNAAWRVSRFIFADIPAPASKSSSSHDLMQEQGQGRMSNSFSTMIKWLADRKSEISFPESKITSLLREAFGGNFKTTVLITASPASYSISDTISAIRLGHRCRKILNYPRFCHFSTPSSKFRKGEIPRVDEENSTLRASSGGPKEVSKEQNPILPEQIQDAIKRKTESESLICSLQTEVQLLRKRNVSLKDDIKKKDLIIMEQRKDLKSFELKVAASEHKLETSYLRERDALMFMRQYRKLCWKLQKDLTRDRSKEVSSIASLLPGTPDLTGLVELDTLLLHAGFIDQRDISDVDDDEDDSLDEYLSEPTASTLLDNAYVDFPQKDFSRQSTDDDLGTGTTANIHTDVNNASKWANQRRTGFKMRLNAIASHLPFQSHQSPQSSFSSRRSCPNDPPHENKGRNTAANNGNSGISQRVQHKHEKELRTVAQKCVELQVLLNEEKSKLQALTTKGGNLNNKKLSQEVLTLTKERDEMMHNAKAAFWKLQELHSVNKIMLKKALDSKAQVASLEEGFQRLQQSFRETALDALETEKKMYGDIAKLQSVIDALTNYDDQNMELPVCNLNFTLRGKGKKKSSSVENKNLGIKELFLRRQRFAWFKRSMKRRVLTSNYPVRKFRRRSRRTGDSHGGANKLKILLKKGQKFRLILFEGSDHFFSVVRGMAEEGMVT